MLLTIKQVAELACDTEEHIQEFIRDERIPYVAVPDGIMIPLGGFQNCMHALYDLEINRP